MAIGPDGNQFTRLRKRLILGAVASVSLALIAICAAINALDYHLTCQRADDVIRVIHGGGEVSSPLPRGSASRRGRNAGETSGAIYFMATIGDDGGISSLDTTHILPTDTSEMIALAREILASGAEGGFNGPYRFSVFDAGDGDREVVILDCSNDLAALVSLRKASLAVCAVCIILTFALLIPLSKRIVRPFERNAERQRRFVADVSHEIKTPIAIIAANNDLLEQLNGPSRWIDSSRSQVERIDGMVRGLIELVQAEEPLDGASLEPLDLRQMMQGACEDFQSLAETHGKRLVGRAEGTPAVMGDAGEMERLFGILLDNAIKYCEGEGPIVVEVGEVSRQMRRLARIRVSNPGAALSGEEAERIFDRFYRTDPSRAHKTGSYGIGLALARAIATRHGGSIAAESTEGSVTVVVTLPSCKV